jgi:hypothetical protein
MRTCARVALMLMFVSASFSLGGCAAVDDLKSAISQWFETAKFPYGRDVFPGDAPEATPIISPEKKDEAAKASRKMAEPARKLKRQQTVKLRKPPTPVSDSTEGEGPATKGHSAPSQSAPFRLRTPYPEAPPPGVFSPFPR